MLSYWLAMMLLSIPWRHVRSNGMPLWVMKIGFRARWQAEWIGECDDFHNGIRR